MSKRRVVITGLGTVNPLALDVLQTWQALCAGKSGISSIEHYDTSQFSTHIAGTVKGFDVSELMSLKEARRMDLFIQYAIAAAQQAYDDANFSENLNKTRVGVAVGAGIGGIGYIEQAYDDLDRKSTRLNSSHVRISYAVFCLKKKKKKPQNRASAPTSRRTWRSSPPFPSRCSLLRPTLPRLRT